MVALGFMPPSALDPAISALLPELRELRHDLHRHPELGFEEHRTSALVRERLERLGYAVRASAETGLVADLSPELAADTPLALRADLDCLPIHESLEIPWRSVHPGRSHKCGHDGHTAILLGTAELLAQLRPRLRANVRLLFQPAEEGVRGGGARVMVAEGALEGVREIYGLHNWPSFPKGEVRVRPGPVMAQVHRLSVLIGGVGGHGSQPQLCRDPILAGAQLVTALQSVVSRGLGYEGGAVVSVCSFQAGTTDNVIPGEARLLGTIRTFEPRVTERVLERIREVVAGVASTFGVHTDLEITPGYPVLVNDVGCAEAVARVARVTSGVERVSGEELPIAGGEDFAYFAETIPAAYFFLGAGRPGEVTPMCHHPAFDFDDDLLPLGMRLFVGLVFDRLGLDRSS